MPCISGGESKQRLGIKPRKSGIFFRCFWCFFFDRNGCFENSFYTENLRNRFFLIRFSEIILTWGLGQHCSCLIHSQSIIYYVMRSWDSKKNEHNADMTGVNRILVHLQKVWKHFSTFVWVGPTLIYLPNLSNRQLKFQL